MDNTTQESARYYDEFFGPLYFEPYAIEVAKRIHTASATIVLEIASGTGRVTRHIRERIPSSTRLIASDIDDNMLAVAKENLAHLNIEWQNIDAQELPFGDGTIDLVICCFGYMFVPDRAKAFAEVYRVLKPGSQFLFTTWDRLENNPVSYLSVSLANSYLREPLPESNDLSTSMNDEAIITPLLQKAGFTKFAIEKVKLHSFIATAKDAAHGLVEGSRVHKPIRQQNSGDIDKLKLKLEAELAARFGAAPMIAPISAVISTAWK